MHRLTPLVLLVFLLSCGDDVADAIGDAMIVGGDAAQDLGRSLADLGADLSDLGADAQAQPPERLEAPCTQESTSGLWALFDVPSVSAGDPPRLRATVCSDNGLPPRTPPFDVFTCANAPRIDFGEGQVAVACFGVEPDTNGRAILVVEPLD